MKNLPIFEENNGVYYPNNDNIPFLFNNRFYNQNWLNKNNNRLRYEYYMASEYTFRRKIETLEQATEFMQKLYDLIEVKGIKFTSLHVVTYNDKRLYYYKDNPKETCSTTNPAKVQFILLDSKDICIVDDDTIIKNIIQKNNADVNELYAFDFETKTMFPNLKCKTWV
jgi:hypothetical protein